MWVRGTRLGSVGRVLRGKLAVTVDKRKVSEEPQYLVQCVAIVSCSHSH